MLTARAMLYIIFPSFTISIVLLFFFSLFKKIHVLLFFGWTSHHVFLPPSLCEVGGCVCAQILVIGTLKHIFGCAGFVVTNFGIRCTLILSDSHVFYLVVTTATSSK